MGRLSVFAAILAVGLVGLVAASRSTIGAGAQDATPAPGGHSLVGSWVVHETLPPMGGRRCWPGSSHSSPTAM